MKRIRERLVKDEGGFTLPELMVTMLMMVMVLFALYNIFDMSIRVFSFGNDKTEAVENARLGLEKMEREIRAAYPQGSSGTLFNTWNSNSIAFGNDLDGNRTIECVASGTPPCETISYDVYSTGSTYALGRKNSFGGVQQPVVEFVNYVNPSNTGLSFRYFTGDGTEIDPASPAPFTEADIRRVQITLRIEVKRGPQAGTQTLTTDVALRNRGS